MKTKALILIVILLSLANCKPSDKNAVSFVGDSQPIMGDETIPSGEPEAEWLDHRDRFNDPYGTVASYEDCIAVAERQTGDDLYLYLSDIDFDDGFYIRVEPDIITLVGVGGGIDGLKIKSGNCEVEFIYWRSGDVNVYWQHSLL